MRGLGQERIVYDAFPDIVATDIGFGPQIELLPIIGASRAAITKCRGL